MVDDPCMWIFKDDFENRSRHASDIFVRFGTEASKDHSDYFLKITVRRQAPQGLYSTNDEEEVLY